MLMETCINKRKVSNGNLIHKKKSAAKSFTFQDKAADINQTIYFMCYFVNLELNKIHYLNGFVVFYAAV